MAEAALLISAHKCDDLESDFDVLTTELTHGDAAEAVQGLLARVVEANSRLESFCADYERWRVGSKVTPQSRVKVARHLHHFRSIVTSAVDALHAAGHNVPRPDFPLSPLPRIALSTPDDQVQTGDGGAPDYERGAVGGSLEVGVAGERQGGAGGQKWRSPPALGETNI